MARRRNTMIKEQVKLIASRWVAIYNLTCSLRWGVAVTVFLLMSHVSLENALASMNESSPLIQNHQIDESRNICIEDAKPLDKSNVLASDEGIPLTEPGLVGPPISLGCQLRYCGPSQEIQDKQRIELQLQLTGDAIAESIVLELSQLPISKGKTYTSLIEVIHEAATVNTRTGSMSIRIPREKRVSILLSQDLVRDGTYVATKPRVRASLVLNKPVLQKLLSVPMSVTKRPNWTANLDVEQFKGSARVNEYRVRYHIRQCQSVAPQQNRDSLSTDRIALTNIKSTHRRVGFVNAQVSGEKDCLRYKSVVGTNVLPIGNQAGNLISPNTECQPNEIVVFSPDRAAYFGSPSPDWSVNKNDLVEIELPKQPVVLPVSIKVLSTSREQTTIREIQSQLETELNHANQLFGPLNNCGVKFKLEIIQDKRREATNGLGQMSCQEQDTRLIQRFTNGEWINPNTINVFYVSNAPRHVRGSHCGFGIFIGEDRTIETLAHELGHELGLADAQEENGKARAEILAKNNLMTSGGKGRTELSNGQCYRVYTNETSKLRVLKTEATSRDLHLPLAKNCSNPTGLDSNCMDIGAIVKTHTSE